ncbi:translational activator GCN1-like [Elysia marginata]|uniref:Translational activator GCN1-like n=1 Tax=Elysia marginata TaxID=1093978 RepID=A0AAV4HB07_9GAST|nr:translational activator GCN1-like [Elysia marginata]
MKSDSNDVKVLVGQIVMYLCDTSEARLTGRFQGDVSLVPSLVVGTKEKNTLVRTCCEGALLSILKLRHGDDIYQAILSSLDSGMQDSLKEVVSRSVKKLATQPESPVEEIDDTILR